MKELLHKQSTMWLIFGAWALFSMVTWYRRTIVDWELNGISETSFEWQVYAPIFAFVVAIFLRKIQTDPLRKYLVVQNVNAAIIVTSIISLFFIITRLAGWWWTWETLNLHILTVILVAYLVRDRLKAHDALILGAGMASLAAGVWEVVYQVEYYNAYNLAELQPLHLVGQMRYLGPMWFGGLLIFLYYHKAVAQWFLPGLVIGLAFGVETLWYFTGFWTDIYFDFDVNAWQYNEFNYWQFVLYKSSKSILALGVVLLFVPQVKGARLEHRAAV